MGKTENFPTLASLDAVKQVIAEADKALHTPTSTIKGKDINKTLAGAIGGGVGAGVGVGVAEAVGGGAGAAGAGIGLIERGLVESVGSGIGVAGAAGLGAGTIAAIIAVPVILLGGGAVAWVIWRNNNKKKQGKEKLLQDAIRKLDAINRELSHKVDMAEARIKSLTAINVRLIGCIKLLQQDLNLALT